MANFEYPTREDLEWFTVVLRENKFTISKYLPPVSEDWFDSVMSCINYVQQTSAYESNTLHGEATKLLYKVAKAHDLADSNKRSALMTVILFCLLNDHRITEPAELKKQAKRIAKTKGRLNEMVMRRRVSSVMSSILEKI